MSEIAASLFRQSKSTKDGQTVQLNKGHFCLDTDERLLEFSKKLASGWEEEYGEYRKLWTELPKNRTVRDYPLLVDLELASICNLKCPMCYTITDEFKQKVTQGFMDFDMFKRIIDEIAGKVYAIRLSFRGEPLLHKNFTDCVTYAKNAGIQEVSSLTNGANLKGKKLEKILKSGIDWITVSIDGTGETYEKIRKPIKFKQIIDNLTQIKNYKEKNNLMKPVIKVQGIWPAIREDPELYYNTFFPITDLIAFNPLIDYLRKDENIIYVDDFSCPQLYQRIVIGSDGKVMMCSNDEDGKALIGDANEQTVHQIWHGPHLNAMRKKHSCSQGFKSIETCNECYFPRKTEVNESVQVNGRTIHIENYLNRQQTIGT
jgi:radical SAM protein with 4Fe4S-binding SPASM domain